MTDNRVTLLIETVERGDPNSQPDTWLQNAGWRTKRSLAQLTREALPRIENSKRPSLEELYGDHLITEEGENQSQRETKSPTSVHEIKLGWIKGVLIPCLLNMWGVILFLRLSWVVSQAGVGLTLVMIVISAIVCVITTLSMSAICANGEMKRGGIYYIISRLLGPEFGASLVITFAFANTMAASMNIIGFCNSLNDLLKTQGVKIIDNGVVDVRIVGAVTLIVLCIICAVGMDWESKAQTLLLAIIVGAMVDFVVGILMGPKDPREVAQGFVGLSADTFFENYYSYFEFSDFLELDFFSVFAIFFPSVTGIQAGANISGDLEDPASAIPKGTLLSLLISMVSYALMVLFFGGGALINATGNVSDLIMANGTVLDYSGVTRRCWSNSYGCSYGLRNSYSVMQLMSAWGPFVYAGCWAATLSTAFRNLLSVPRLIQALGVDRFYPGLIFFSKPYGKHGEPYRAYALTFFVSLVFLLIANLNTIAPLISNFYLASYALINFCTFNAALVRPLGWRPTFRYYNASVSLIGFVMCVSLMLFISWIMTLVTSAIFLTLSLIVHYRIPASYALIRFCTIDAALVHLRSWRPNFPYYNVFVTLFGFATCIGLIYLIDWIIIPVGAGIFVTIYVIVHNWTPDITWGISTQAHMYKSALSGVLNLARSKEASKNFWPQLLVLGGKPSDRPALVDLGNLVTKSGSLMVVGDISQKKLSYKERAHRARAGDEWLRARKVRAFCAGVNGFSFEAGARALMQASGVGRLAPNVLLMGYKADWASAPAQDLDSYFNVLHTAFETRLAVAIVRVSGGLDYSAAEGEAGGGEGGEAGALTATSSGSGDLRVRRPQAHIMHADSDLDIRSAAAGSQPSSRHNLNMHRQVAYKLSSRIEVSTEQLSQMTIFKRTQEEGTLDVWWLYDDGGLTILLPYIISQRAAWRRTRLRIFVLANRKHEMEQEEKKIVNLLSKFRIGYSSLTMVQDITKPPQPETKKLFEEIIKKFTDENRECSITETELATLCEKTHRQLRLRELLLANSSQAQLIVMSLPMPRKGSVSAPLYMSWLEVMSRDMPPMLFVRGNQTSVLTFYS